MKHLKPSRDFGQSVTGPSLLNFKLNILDIGLIEIYAPTADKGG